MSQYLITLDTGTTNSRMKLFCDRRMIDQCKISVGVRNTTLTGNNQLLKSAIREGLLSILQKNHLAEAQIEMILGSGMLVSELGLFCIPHAIAPVDVKELALQAKKVILSEITAVPFLFIPGVKNCADYSSLEALNDMDMMRGEEVEFFGIRELMRQEQPFTVVLPGSHTKVIFSDGQKILSCQTAMTGELLQTISEGTILKNSLPKTIWMDWDVKALQEGCCYTQQHGFTKAMFRTRLLKNFLQPDDRVVSSFFVGSVLSDDIRMILSSGRTEGNIFVGGSNHLKAGFAALLEMNSKQKIVKLSDDITEMSTSVGAFAVYDAFCGH